MASFRDHFAAPAGDYAAFRPGYPPALAARLAALAPGYSLAWDVGTGSGQAAVLLADHFLRVVATDASARQLAHAEPRPNVEYRLGPAEHSGLADGTVDLVTVAQALHWFDVPAFYQEADRVLRPGGVLAAWTYGLPEVDAAVDAALRWFHAERVGRHWPYERRHVDDGYSALGFPYPAEPVAGWATERTLTRDQLCGYVGTWSAVAQARAEEGADPLPELVERLRPAWPETVSRRLVRWPLVVRVGRKPA